jgi:hypothetical protein
MQKNYFLLVIFVFMSGPSPAKAQQPYQWKLLPPLGINKSTDQIQFEAEEGRKSFSGANDENPPRKFDLLKILTPVKDQGYRGTCVAFAIVGLIESQLKRFTGKSFDLSEQYLYWESKFLNPIMPTADGSYALPLLRTIDVNVAHTRGEEYRGVPLEAVWPYEEYSWYQKRKEHPECYKAAKINAENIPKICLTNGSPTSEMLSSHKMGVTDSRNIPSSVEAITGYLRLGLPVIISVDFYTRAWGFHNYRGSRYLTGAVEYPEKGDENEGGHAVLIVGYDLDSQRYLFKNSWGTTDWAKDSALPGFGTIPFDYVRKHAVATVAKVPLEP